MFDYSNATDDFDRTYLCFFPFSLMPETFYSSDWDQRLTSDDMKIKPVPRIVYLDTHSGSIDKWMDLLKWWCEKPYWSFDKLLKKFDKKYVQEKVTENWKKKEFTKRKFHLSFDELFMFSLMFRKKLQNINPSDEAIVEDTQMIIKMKWTYNFWWVKVWFFNVAYTFSMILNEKLHIKRIWYVIWPIQKRTANKMNSKIKRNIFFW